MLTLAWIVQLLELPPPTLQATKSESGFVFGLVGLKKMRDKNRYLVSEFGCLVLNRRFVIDQHYFVLRNFWQEGWLRVDH